MTTYEAEEFIEKISSYMFQLTLDELDTICQEAKNRGLNVRITQELIVAFHNDMIGEYLDSQT